MTTVAVVADIAWDPSPGDNSTADVERALPLTWSPAGTAVQHDVYLGTDRAVVENADASDTSGVYRGRQDPNSYNPPEAVELGRTYYWRIDEVFADGNVTKGKVWSFAVAEVVDNFEDYDDINNRIFDVWADYFTNNTGATVGYFDPPLVEKTIVHEGSQSLPYHYDNDGAVNEGTDFEKIGTAFYSEAEREWATPQDWTANAAEFLALWFRGLPPLYGSFTTGPPMTMTARGTGIAGASDQFHFVYQPLSGDGSITARIVSLTDTGPGVAVGVMIRETLAADAMHAAVAVTPASGVAVIGRASEGGNSTTVSAEAGITTPQWVRLTRMGRTFTAEYSSDGNAWTGLGDPLTIPMSTDALIGLSLTAGTASATCTAEFSDMTTTATGQLLSEDVGIESNAPEQFYVALQDSSSTEAIVLYPEPNATTIDVWTEWNVALADFTGVDPQAITKISLGVGDRTNQQPGASGMLYVDNITLRPAEESPQDPDLLMHYALDGNPTDASGNGYDGTVQGDPQWVDGIIDGALVFDGGDYVGTGNTEQLENWTVACWVTSPAVPASGPYGGLVNRQGNYQINWDHPNEAFQGVAAVNAGGFQGAGFGPVQADTWYHIAATYDGNTLKAYRDGVLITATEAPGVPANAAREMRFGMGSFAGTLDDVRVYRRALTDAEIAEVGGFEEPDLAGHYKLDETRPMPPAMDTTGRSRAIRNGSKDSSTAPWRSTAAIS